MKNKVLKRLTLIICFYHFSAGTIAQNISGVVNSYYRVTSVNITTSRVTVSNAAGLAPGMKVLIIQMKGAVINSDNLPSFGDISNIDQAGSYEFNTVCGIAGNEVLLQFELTKPYNSSGSVQLIPVPQYNIVTVSNTITANGWDAASGTGGVVVLEADTIYLSAPIDVAGQGFAGGAFVNFATPTYDCSWAVNVTNYFLPLVATPNQYYSGAPKGEGIAAFIANAEYGRGKQASGGGGGNNHNTGGAGGSNFGRGGNGGQRSNESFFLCHGSNPGIGGIALSSYGYSSVNNRLFMGGGGGSSHQNNSKGMPGGNGGGIILINANVIIGNGPGLHADGLSPVNLTNIDPYTAEGDGGGGGGAGGSIILNVNEVIGNIDATARGARGSDASRGVTDCTGPGGGGGGGVVWMKGAGFLPGVSATVTGGGNGVISAFSSAPCIGQSNSATPGDNGSTMSDYLPPASGNFLCTPLPVAELKYFKGRAEEKTVSVSWAMFSIGNIRGYEIERSIDHVSFSAIQKIANEGSYQFTINDKHNLSGTFFYRLKLIRLNGSVGYSPIISITKSISSVIDRINIYPNPAINHIKLSAAIQQKGVTNVSIFNAFGQRVYFNELSLPAGYSTLTIPITKFSPGIYWLMLESGELQERKKFIKVN